MDIHEDVLFKGSKAHFKKYGTMTSVEGKTNKSGIRFRDNKIHWNGLIFLLGFEKMIYLHRKCFLAIKLNTVVSSKK